jgi:hypothetical protein
VPLHARPTLTDVTLLCELVIQRNDGKRTQAPAEYGVVASAVAQSCTPTLFVNSPSVPLRDISLSSIMSILSKSIVQHGPSLLRRVDVTNYTDAITKYCNVNI